MIPFQGIAIWMRSIFRKELKKSLSCKTKADRSLTRESEPVTAFSF